MRLITLNTWGGHVREPLFEFLRAEAGDTDIFCLQEVFNGGDPSEAKMFTNLPDIRDVDADLFEDVREVLSGYRGFFCPFYKNIFGTAVFIRDGIDVLDSGEVWIYKNESFPNIEESDEDIARKMQWLKLKARGGKEFVVMNVHGHWSSKGKGDSDGSLRQSEILLEFINSNDGPKILCGDFNLRPDTKSIGMLEAKMDNLIKKFDVQGTRTELYAHPEKYADYIFTSPGLRIASFGVLPDVVSDHSPLALEFKV